MSRWPLWGNQQDGEGLFDMLAKASRLVFGPQSNKSDEEVVMRAITEFLRAAKSVNDKENRYQQYMD